VTPKRCYRCSRPRYTRDTGCAGSISAEKIEQEVWQAVEHALSNPQLIAEEVARRHDRGDAEASQIEQERTRYLGQLARMERDIQKWEAAYLADILSLADFGEKKQDIAIRQAAIQKEIERLDREVEQLARLQEETRTLTDYCERVRSRLANFGYTDKRLAL